ncbi:MULTISPECIES: hemolysin family protein [Fusobacterium]|uniref:hemolysin family protein n=1 Tax=Fusobacterium TaxID=848 RepID=UPI001476BA38|nr:MULTISPECIES: hemolysin family protein [Fusobacterium]NME36106.1 HlyC/CorC family transporter [Fusobacterium sp. FSA-380-WT-3A]
MDTYRDLILLVILIMLSGFFSASETALTAFSSIHLEDISEKSPKKGELLKKWLKKPTDILTALLLGNNIVNIFSTSLATALITKFLTSKGTESQGRVVLISTVVMTLVILIFGEITPKIIAKNHSTTISKKVIIPIHIMTKVFKPFIIILTSISKLLSRLLGIEIKDNAVTITEQDIISYVNVGKAEGVIENEEKDMIESIVTFGDTLAREVMTPRTAVYAFDGEEKVEDILEKVVEKGFSRIPVYNEGIDDIIGILYAKDLLVAMKEGKKDSKVKEFVRKAFFIPETKSVLSILEDFKKDHVHMAIVVDEYGGTVGVVTIEDVIEEIFGDIRDEYDLNEKDTIKQISENTYEVDGMMDVEELNKELNINLPESDDYDSLGGLILNELNEIAKKDDVIKIENIELKVLEVDKVRISKVLLHIGGIEEEC